MHIEIYTKTDCDFCTNLKEFLERKKLSYTENRLNEDFTREGLKEKFPTALTYPVVVVDGFMIGGYTEFANAVALNEQLQTSQKLLVEGTD
jgi:glutaredoxin